MVRILGFYCQGLRFNLWLGKLRFRKLWGVAKKKKKKKRKVKKRYSKSSLKCLEGIVRSISELLGPWVKHSKGFCLRTGANYL